MTVGSAMPVLTREQARRVYDRIGALQDTQAFYEDRVTAILIENAELGTAQRVFEFGCGTGRFARRLLSKHLPESARYQGVDQSPRMAALARRRLASFGSRAEVVLTDGSPPTAAPGSSCDRFISNFVLDLLSEEDIAAVVREAHRILEAQGLLCLSSLSTGRGFLASLAARGWTRVHAIRPALLGGCRPLDLLCWVSPQQWSIRHHAHTVPFGVPSEVVVAQRR